MFASIVTDERCALFCVVRVDHATTPWTYTRMSGFPPSDFRTAVRRAADYQRWFDPDRERFTFRCGHCD